MKTILNQEHVEARQAEITKANNLLKEGLSPEDRAKYESVESLVADLEAKGIPIYLYAWLPSLVKPELSLMVQYNNMAATVGFDSKGNLNQKIGEVNDALISSVWNTFGESHGGDFRKWTYMQYCAILREQKRLGLVGEDKQ